MAGTAPIETDLNEPDTAESTRQRDHAQTARTIRRSVTRMSRRLRVLRSDHGVSASKLSLLGRLNQAKAPMIATELAQLERLQPQSLTRLIADLDAHGFIQRRQAEADRRQLLIEITAKGSELLATDARQQDAWLAQVMTARLTGAERQVLRIAAELLDRLADEDASATSARDI
jgi:DNA-binding MarR family transcriptional regulator